MNRRRLLTSMLLATTGLSVWGAGLPTAGWAQTGGKPDPAQKTFSTRELVDSGHQFFGTISRGLAQAIEEATKRWGQPNGYILGQEAGGAFFGGLRYGEGKL